MEINVLWLVKVGCCMLLALFTVGVILATVCTLIMSIRGWYERLVTYKYIPKEWDGKELTTLSTILFFCMLAISILMVAGCIALWRWQV